MALRLLNLNLSNANTCTRTLLLSCPHPMGMCTCAAHTQSCLHTHNHACTRTHAYMSILASSLVQLCIYTFVRVFASLHGEKDGPHVWSHTSISKSLRTRMHIKCMHLRRAHAHIFMRITGIHSTYDGHNAVQHARTRARMHTRTCACTHVHICAHTHARTYACKRRRARTHTHTHTHTHMHTHAYEQALKHVCMPRSVSKRHACTHACTHGIAQRSASPPE